VGRYHNEKAQAGIPTRQYTNREMCPTNEEMYTAFRGQNMYNKQLEINRLQREALQEQNDASMRNMWLNNF
jgi:hypothetical protein